MKRTIVSLILLVAVAVTLFLPWYQVTTARQLAQTSTYLTESLFSTATTETQTVYSLSQPVTIQPAANPLACVSSNFLINPQCEGFSSAVNGFLWSGSTIQVTVIECQNCYFFLWNSSPPNIMPVIISGSGQKSVTLNDTESGNYVITVVNIGTVAGTITQVSVAATVSQIVELTQTLAAYSITSLTTFSQATTALYSSFGVLPSVTILVVVAIGAMFVVLKDIGLFLLSKRQHRKRLRSARRRRR